MIQEFLPDPKRYRTSSLITSFQVLPPFACAQTAHAHIAARHLQGAEQLCTINVPSRSARFWCRAVRHVVVSLCNSIVNEGCIPEDWKSSVILPIYKGKGDPMECGSYRGIKLLGHTMKVVERIFEHRIGSRLR